MPLVTDRDRLNPLLCCRPRPMGDRDVTLPPGENALLSQWEPPDLARCTQLDTSIRRPTLLGAHRWTPVRTKCANVPSGRLNRGRSDSKHEANKHNLFFYSPENKGIECACGLKRYQRYLPPLHLRRGNTTKCLPQAKGRPTLVGRRPNIRAKGHDVQASRRKS